MGLIPILTVADRTDARLVFDALNVAYSAAQDAETRQRLAVLLIAAHAETLRNDYNESEQS